MTHNVVFFKDFDMLDQFIDLISDHPYGFECSTGDFNINGKIIFCTRVVFFEIDYWFPEKPKMALVEDTTTPMNRFRTTPDGSPFNLTIMEQLGRLLKAPIKISDGQFCI